jgi:LPS export ABC transporter protein LptC
MLKLKKYRNTIMVTAFAVTILFSCQDNFKDIQKIGLPQTEASSEAEDINLKYTDSGVVKANLISPKMLDFSNREFGYQEFPDGLHLIMFDDDGKQSDIFADYGIIHSETDLIDLQKNVIIATHSKDTLFAEQLYYDQEKEWLFTNLPVEFKTQSQRINANAYSSDRKIEKGGLSEVTGIVYLDEN